MVEGWGGGEGHQYPVLLEVNTRISYIPQRYNGQQFLFFFIFFIFFIKSKENLFKICL